MIEGETVNELLGGFDSTIIPWDPTSEFTIVITDDVTYASAFESELAFVEAFAYDIDTGVFEDRVFPYTIDGGTLNTDAPVRAPSADAPVGAPTGRDAEEPSSSPGRFGGWFTLTLSFLIPSLLQLA